MSYSKIYRYPKFLKSIARRMPVLKNIILERDQLRLEIQSLRIKPHDFSEIKIGAKNTGYCHCCRTEVRFQINSDWLRDNYVCLNCYSIPRQRHLQYVLDNFYPGWDSLSIHESSPSNGLISAYCKNYSSSQFFANINSGKYHNGIRCEDLEKLSFQDNSFDVFITQDVFEHIYEPASAAKEILRVLRPGGIHIFTVPRYNIPKTIKCASLENDLVTHHMEPEYHGNPVGDGKSLVTYRYGKDFEDLYSLWTGG